MLADAHEYADLISLLVDTLDLLRSNLGVIALLLLLGICHRSGLYSLLLLRCSPLHEEFDLIGKRLGSLWQMAIVSELDLSLGLLNEPL